MVCGWKAFVPGLIMAVVLACAGAVGLSASGDSSRRDDDQDVVRTDRGPVKGIVVGKMQAFLGIPYAAAPVGDLRWQPPQPHARWRSPLNAATFGAHCPQGLSPFAGPSGTEDCLFLNVFAPRSHRSHEGRGDEYLRPVMVWIHGGGLTGGESNDYIPTRLVDEDTVVVTINYRLGLLGFFVHPALSAESADQISGNSGTWINSSRSVGFNVTSRALAATPAT